LKTWSKERLKAYQARWARSPQERAGTPVDPLDVQFEQFLDGWLQFHKGILLDELVGKTWDVLHHNPLLLKRWQFDYVVVDEYQDLNGVEQEFVELLSERGQLIIAGDEDQSLYQHLRYAHPEGIRQFASRHPATRTFEFEWCRRCPQTTVEMARTLIKQNMDRHPRGLQSLREDSGEVSILQWRTLDAEVEGVSDIIAEYVQRKSLDPKDILLLLSRKKMASWYVAELSRRGVPAISCSADEVSVDIAERLTLLNLAVDPDDRVAIRTWLALGDRKQAFVKPFSILKGICLAEGKSPKEILESLRDWPKGLASMLSRWQEATESITVIRSLSGINLVDYLFPESSAEFSEARLVALGALQEETTLAGFRDRLTDLLLRPEISSSTKELRVMSLHKSKGLTARAVFIVGCINGGLPSKISLLEPGSRPMLEEQRRLFYVGVTRATQVLVMSGAASISTEQAYRYKFEVHTPSRRELEYRMSKFLRELGPAAPQAVPAEEWLESIRRRPDPLLPPVPVL